MPRNKQFPNRLAGIPFIDVTDKITTGLIFWVDSNTGSNNNSGDDPTRPFATLDYAVGMCRSNKNDTIYVMPAHAETIVSATGANLDVAGITVIGLGNGDNKPTFTMATSTSACMDLNAAGVKICNLRFVAGVDSLKWFVTVGENFCTIDSCHFVGGATYQFLCGINIETTYDNTTVTGCVFRQDTDPTGTHAAVNTGLIYLVDSENVTVENCRFYGNFETAFIHNKTTAAANLWVRNCVGYVQLSTAFPYILVEGATGGDVGSLYVRVAATDVTTAQLFGTESTKYFVASWFGNDSGGGQGAVFVTAAA